MVGSPCGRSRACRARDRARARTRSAPRPRARKILILMSNTGGGHSRRQGDRAGARRGGDPLRSSSAASSAVWTDHTFFPYNRGRAVVQEDGEELLGSWKVMWKYAAAATAHRAARATVYRAQQARYACLTETTHRSANLALRAPHARARGQHTAARARPLVLSVHPLLRQTSRYAVLRRADAERAGAPRLRLLQPPQEGRAHDAVRDHRDRPRRRVEPLVRPGRRRVLRPRRRGAGDRAGQRPARRAAHAARPADQAGVLGRRAARGRRAAGGGDARASTRPRRARSSSAAATASARSRARRRPRSATSSAARPRRAAARPRPRAASAGRWSSCAARTRPRALGSRSARGQRASASRSRASSRTWTSTWPRPTAS